MRALGSGAVCHDELCLRTEHPAEAQPEIHRHADDQRDVGLLQRFRTRPGESQFVVGGHDAAGHAVHQDRDAQLLGQTQQRGLPATPPDVGAGHDHRPLCLRQQVGDPIQRVGIRGRGRGEVAECTGSAVIV